MSDSITEIELTVLRSLDQEPKSTKGLMSEIIDLSDRAETSLLLNGLMKDGFIRKASNGYWRLERFGDAYLQNHDGKGEAAQDQETQDHIKTTEELLAEELENESFVLGEAVDSIEEASPAIEADSVKSNSCWDAVKSLMKDLPGNTSFVIENSSASIVFANSQFSLKQEGDMEAVLRAAELYQGQVVTQ